ncbi:MAG: cupin domain-containing protein [Betaproteobacteria bacterium]|nr:cupin domain-containing protein [Betaproteobacteria bacterium]
MKPPIFPAAVHAAGVPPRLKTTIYPEPFASRVAGREKSVLGDLFGLTNFGVNLTRLRPGAISALRHAHSKQDEFIYVLEGHPVLVTKAGEMKLEPGMCAGFRAGAGDAHHLVNRSKEDVLYLEVGDRTADDDVVYPDDDLRLTRGADGKRSCTRRTALHIESRDVSGEP